MRGHGARVLATCLSLLMRKSEPHARQSPLNGKSGHRSSRDMNHSVAVLMR
jgi:hypothetical protein